MSKWGIWSLYICIFELIYIRSGHKCTRSALGGRYRQFPLIFVGNSLRETKSPIYRRLAPLTPAVTPGRWNACIMSKKLLQKGIFYTKIHLNHTFTKQHTEYPWLTIKYGQKKTLSPFVVEKCAKDEPLRWTITRLINTYIHCACTLVFL
jgi:hypothetical protein